MSATPDTSNILASAGLGGTDIVNTVQTFTSQNFTISSGAFRVAIAHLFTSDPAAVISVATPPTVGGVTGTLVPGADTGNVASATGRVRTYVFLNPASGSQVGSFTISSAACNLGMAIETFTNADQTTGANGGTAFQANSSPGAASSVTVTSTNGDMTSSGGFSANAWGSTGPGTGTITNQTLLILGASNSWGFDRGPGTGNTTHTWSDQFTGQEHAISAVNVLAAVGGNDLNALVGEPITGSSPIEGGLH